MEIIKEKLFLTVESQLGRLLKKLIYLVVRAMFTNILSIRRVAAKFVTKLLNFQQKMHCKTVVKEKIRGVANDLTVSVYRSVISVEASK